MSANGRIVNIHDKATFDREVIEASKERLVVIECWAPWCFQCRALAAVYNEVANEYYGADKSAASLCAMNVSDDLVGKDVAQQYNISGLPVFLFFKNGELIAREMDISTKADILSKIEELAS